MNEIVLKMQETVQAIDAANLRDEGQIIWADWWRRHLDAAVKKAIRAGWVVVDGN